MKSWMILGLVLSVNAIAEERIVCVGITQDQTPMLVIVSKEVIGNQFGYQELEVLRYSNYSIRNAALKKCNALNSEWKIIRDSKVTPRSSKTVYFPHAVNAAKNQSSMVWTAEKTIETELKYIAGEIASEIEEDELLDDAAADSNQTETPAMEWRSDSEIFGNKF